MRKISDLVKRQRVRLSATLEDIHKKTKLSQGFLSRLEKGDYDGMNVSLDTIIRLATGLGIKVKDFLDQLKVIETDETPSLSVFLRQKYDIKNSKDIEMVEDIINRLKDKTNDN